MASCAVKVRTATLCLALRARLHRHHYWVCWRRRLTPHAPPKAKKLAKNRQLKISSSTTLYCFETAWNEPWACENSRSFFSNRPDAGRMANYTAEGWICSLRAAIWTPSAIMSSGALRAFGNISPSSSSTWCSICSDSTFTLASNRSSLASIARI